MIIGEGLNVNMAWYLYIIECRDKSLYTGVTRDINRRIKEHNDGKGAKSLLGKRPVALKYFEQFKSQSEVMKREREIKGWKREKKLRLILGRATSSTGRASPS